MGRNYIKGSNCTKLLNLIFYRRSTIESTNFYISIFLFLKFVLKLFLMNDFLTPIGSEVTVQNQFPEPRVQEAKLKSRIARCLACLQSCHRGKNRQGTPRNSSDGQQLKRIGTIDGWIREDPKLRGSRSVRSECGGCNRKGTKRAETMQLAAMAIE